MREKTRQAMLRSGAGITKAAAAKLITGSKASYWHSVRGSDWCGRVVEVGGHSVSFGVRRVNGALTGWERSAVHEGKAVELVTGLRLEVHDRNCVGANVDGDRWYATKKWTVTVV